MANQKLSLSFPMTSAFVMAYSERLTDGFSGACSTGIELIYFSYPIVIRASRIASSTIHVIIALRAAFFAAFCCHHFSGLIPWIRNVVTPARFMQMRFVAARRDAPSATCELFVCFLCDLVKAAFYFGVFFEFSNSLLVE